MDLLDFKVGTRVYSANPRCGAVNQPDYIKGIVTKITNNDITVELTNPKSTQTKLYTECFLVEPVVDSDNMAVDFKYASDPAIIDNIVSRYQRNILYTNAGATMLALNPFGGSKDIEAETRTDFFAMKRFRDRTSDAELDTLTNSKVSEVSHLPVSSIFFLILTPTPFSSQISNPPPSPFPQRQQIKVRPHPYIIADEAHERMHGTRQSQVIMCEGQSGSGKSEIAKLILQYLTNIKHLDDFQSSIPTKTKRRVAKGPLGMYENPFIFGPPSPSPSTSTAPQPAFDDESAPNHISRILMNAMVVLEAFGSAKTLENDNSSRFGRFVKVYFSGITGDIAGADISAFVLELSRVVNQQPGDRGFHIFYQLLLGLEQSKKKAHR